MANEVRKTHGITKDTPKNIMLGAGTIHRGLKYESKTKKWNFNETIIGATSGGSELEIAGEYIDVPVDGAFVYVKGLTFKQGGHAQLKTNMVELSPDVLALAAQARVADESDVEGFDKITLSGQIEEGDYVDKFAYVGNTSDGRPIIIIFESALCRSGLKIGGKQKEASIVEIVMEAYAEIEGDLTTIPVVIYYPQLPKAADSEAGK